jgi:non-ribosomal peptide synthetase component F
VGICAGNSAEHIVALLAVLASGKIWVPLNPKSTQPELRRIIDATDAEHRGARCRLRSAAGRRTGRGSTRVMRRWRRR